MEGRRPRRPFKLSVRTTVKQERNKSTNREQGLDFSDFVQFSIDWINAASPQELSNIPTIQQEPADGSGAALLLKEYLLAHLSCSGWVGRGITKGVRQVKHLRERMAK